jgi:hypothetical protein
MKYPVVLLTFTLLTCIGCSTKTAPELLQRAQEAQQRAQHMIDSLGTKADVHEVLCPVISEYEKVWGTPDRLKRNRHCSRLRNCRPVMNNPEEAVDAFRRYATHFLPRRRHRRRCS